MISSIIHAIFFIMMGSRGGFRTCFSAYVLSSCSRAILTGERSFNLRLCRYQLTTSMDSIPQPVLCGWISPIVWICFWILEYVPRYPRTFACSGLNRFQGFGCFSSPLICQAALARGVPWYKFYLVTLVLSGLNTAFLTTTFRPTEREFLIDRKAARATIADELSSCPSSPISSIYKTQKSSSSVEETQNRNGSPSLLGFRSALSKPCLWFLCLFTFIYYGWCVRP